MAGCSSSISRITYLRDRQIRTKDTLVKELHRVQVQPQHRLDSKEVVREGCLRFCNKKASSRIQKSNNKIGSDNNNIKMHTLISKELKRNLNNHSHRCSSTNQTNISNMATQCSINFQTWLIQACNKCPLRATRCSKQQVSCREMLSTSSTHRGNKRPWNGRLHSLHSNSW